MVTSEYAVGTLAAAGVAGVLVLLGAGDWFRDELWDLIRHALRPGVLVEQWRQIPWLR